MLDDGTQVRKLLLFVARQILRGKLGVRDDNLLDAHALGGANESEDLLASEMTRRENHVVPGEAFQTASRGFDEVACVIEDRQRRRRDAFGSQFALDLGPERQLGIPAIQPPGCFVLSVDGRHPDDLASRATRELHRHGIQAADAVIQRDGPEDPDARNGFGHDLRPFASLNVVRFQHEAAHAPSQKFLRAVDVVDAACDDIGADVNLKVVGAFKASPGGIGNCGGRLCGCLSGHEPIKVHGKGLEGNLLAYNTAHSTGFLAMAPNRWRIPLGAVGVHLCIGSVYSWSTFNRPIQGLFPHDPWWFSPPYTTFTTALVLLGLSAAFGGPWVERRGPRVAATAAALFFGIGLILGGLGLALGQSRLVFLGMGVIGGIGCGLGYISPVSTLV